MKRDGFNRRESLKIGLGSALVAALAPSWPGAAAAQQYPTKPVTWVIPFAAGGGTDLWGRILAQALSANMPQPVNPVNMPGASGVIGWRNVLNQPADGSYILQGSPTPIIGLLTERNPPLKPSEIKIVCYISAFRPLLAVRTNAVQKSWPQFVAFAKKNPGKITMGGTSTELIAVSLSLRSAGADVTTIPYSSTSESVTDFLGGHIDSLVAPESTMSKLGREKAIVVLNASRLPFTEAQKKDMGEPPLASALGYQIMSSPRWVGVHPQTPDSIVSYLEGQIKAALQTEPVKAGIAKIGEEIIFVPGAEARADYKSLLAGVESAVGVLKKK